MRNVLALIGLLVVVFAGVGWYCGWYQLSVSKGKEGKPEITTTVNTDKVADDSAAFFKKVGQAITERTQQADPKGAPPTPPGNTPGPVTPQKGDAPKDGWFLAPTKPAAQK